MGLPILAVAFVATLFIKELPLRNRAFADEDAVSKEMLRSANQSSSEGVHSLDQATSDTVKAKLLLTGLSRVPSIQDRVRRWRVSRPCCGGLCARS